MRVFRVENRKGQGPIWGVKRIEKETIDYTGTYMEKVMLERMEPVIFEMDNTISFDSRDHIIDHKTPRENKPFFLDKNGSRYYKFGQAYRFGYSTMQGCLRFPLHGWKSRRVFHREGFLISEYDVNNAIIFRDGQVAFDYNKACLLRRHSYVFAKGLRYTCVSS